MSAKYGKANHNFKHGGRRSFPVEYRAWTHMKGRCYCETDASYHKYGGRGITICDEWRHDFSQFLADMGIRPETSASIERIDNDGGYSPINCRWSNPVEQANNRRSSRLLTYKGETKTAAQWARRTGIKQATLRARIDVYGMTVDQAIETPVKKMNMEKITFNGETHSVREWSYKLGFAKNTISERLRRGASIEDALSTPLVPPKKRRSGLKKMSIEP